jgi:ferritin-like metal-binding protein YciE
VLRNSGGFQGLLGCRLRDHSGAQVIEHYEISKYGTLKAWAEKLGRTRAVEVLARTLTEERNADKILTELAERALNEEAAADA